MVYLEKEEGIDTFYTYSERFDEEINQLQGKAHSKSYRDKIDEIKSLHNSLQEIFDQRLVPAWQEGESKQELEMILADMEKNKAEIDTLINEEAEEVEAHAQQQKEEMYSELKSCSWWMITGIIVVALLGITIAFLISRNISCLLEQVLEKMRQAEEGNLSVVIKNDHLQPCWEVLDCEKPECPAYHIDNLRCWQVSGTHCGDEVQGDMAEKIEDCEECEVYKVAVNNEIERIAEAFNNVMKRLRDMTINVEEAAREVASNSQQLSASSQEASAAVEEISASTHQFAGNVEQLSGTSQQMNKVAEEVNELAGDGLEQMEATQQEMQEILESSEESRETINELNEASEEIGNIIEVIANIAEQTNLLALNANIEAARAGEHGAGFAVVADEIRELAVETQSSVDEVNGIITKLVTKAKEATEIIVENDAQIEEGAEVLNETEEAFRDIVGKIQEVTSQIQEVATAGQELSAGSEEISTTTEGQSTVVQQISTASQQLADMAEELDNLVNKFDF